MDKVKLSIIYYSATGSNHQMSVWAQAAAEADGAEVRRRIVAETAPAAAIESQARWKAFRSQIGEHETLASLDDLEWADAILFSIPTRYGNLPSQLQAFIDTTGPLWAQGKLINKVVSGMTSSMNPQGGQESTLMSLYKVMAHWGAIIVPLGYTSDVVFASGGNPSGASATIGRDGTILQVEQVKATVEHQTRRLLEVARRLKA